MCKKLPYRHATRHRHVQGVLGAALRDLKAHITLVDNLLIHTVYLVSYHKRIATSGLRTEVLKLYAPFHLLKATQGVAVAL